MKSSNTLANLLTLLFLALSMLVCLVTGGWISDTLAVPDRLRPVTEFPIPTQVLQQFWTPSNTPLPSETPPPTLTPEPTDTRRPTATQTDTPTTTPTPTTTETPSDTPLPSNTPLPTTARPSRTVTWTPSATFTASFTATSSPTISQTPTPTGATATRTATFAAFPFQIESLLVGRDPNELCDFQGFAGTVLDQSGAPIFEVNIDVKGPGLPIDGLTVASSSVPTYGLGGWEARVSPTLNTSSYTVQLEDIEGNPLSYPVDYTFTGTCEQNVLYIYFRQERPF
jgi:hypothetical protein